ncbi:SpoIID/LytB domain-containing protein [Myxococcota bacterium]|nr:SpoIID/LytB domain-containing protein [Myxococcota bacterium]
MKRARSGRVIVGLAMAGLLWSPWILASPEMVRVLLLEGVDELVVEHVGVSAGASRVLLDGVHGLRVEGRPEGRVWRVEPRAGGRLRVGEWTVRGWLEVTRETDGLRVVNHVNLEDYVAGTVGRELYPGWEPEMFRAQAVLARTYGLHRASASRARHGLEAGGYDVEATTRGQVYGGIHGEIPAALEAVEATRGLVLMFRGEPILAAYHSASGGRTASAGEVWGRSVPYLVSLPVEHEEESPDTYWRVSISGPTLRRALSKSGMELGDPLEILVASRSGSGRVRTVRIRGTRATKEIQARALRSALGGDVIRSTLFEVRSEAGGFVFMGSGHGHGVGLSQWGAQALAKRGATWREILAAFYPGTDVAPGVVAQ